MIISIPNLFCPFEAKIHPAVDKLEKYTSAWLREFNLLKSEKEYQAFDSYKFAKMTARTYPVTDFKLLCTVSCFNTWLFVVDDALDHIVPDTDKIRDPEFLKNLVADFISIFRYNKLPNKNKETFEICSALEDLWQQLLSLTPVTWQCQFTVSFAATFQAAFWEAENSVLNRRITLSSYKNMRPYFSGANLGTDLIEPTSRISLPYYVQQNRHITKLVELIRRIICWANDIFSLKKELGHGDTHNLVCVLQNEYKTSISKALQKAVQIHNAEIQLYLRLKNELPSFGSKLDHDIMQYLSAMETMVRGFFDWSVFDSARYQ